MCEPYISFFIWWGRGGGGGGDQLPEGRVLHHVAGLSCETYRPANYALHAGTGEAAATADPHRHELHQTEVSATQQQQASTPHSLGRQQ